MARRYRCGTCNLTWPYMSREEAETVRQSHHDTAHGGGAPADDELPSNAERINPMLYVYVLGGCILLWLVDHVIGLFR
ncbi:hypothetical protein [Streptomyces sp. NPDC055140]